MRRERIPKRQLTMAEALIGIPTLCAIIFWMLSLFWSFFHGLSDAQGYGGQCNSRFTRIEIVVPTYRLGCWLGSPLINKEVEQ